MLQKSKTALFGILPLVLSVLSLTSAGAAPSGGHSLKKAEEVSSNDEATPISPIKLSTFRPKQGEVVELILLAKELALEPGVEPPVVEFLGNKYKLFAFESEDGAAYRALLTVPVVQKVGSTAVTVGPFSTRVIVTDAHYPVQRLTLPPSKKQKLQFRLCVTGLRILMPLRKPAFRPGLVCAALLMESFCQTIFIVA